MKFTVEVEDFWLDSEDDIEPQLRKYVITDVANQINKMIKDKVQDQIVRELKKEFEIGYSKKIKDLISESFDSGELKVGSTDQSAKEFFMDQARTSHGWNSVKETLQKLAKDHTDEMKKRYDLYYASHVVNRLSENGLLKDDQLKKLLE